MLRTMGDDIKDKKDNMVAVLSAVNGDKVSLLCVCGAEAVKKGAHAGKIIKEVAKIVGGGGGGRPDSATAGGKNPAKLEEALEAVNNIVDAMLLRTWPIRATPREILPRHTHSERSDHSSGRLSVLYNQSRAISRRARCTRTTSATPSTTLTRRLPRIFS